MPILELIALGTRIYKGGKLAYRTGYKIRERLDVKSTNQDVANWVKKYNYVWFDFSAWSPNDLNLDITSYIFGIPHGQVRVKANGEVWLITCNSTLSGSDIVFLYKWLRANAPSVGNNQRSFRFENGKYASEGEAKSIGEGKAKPVSETLLFAALLVVIVGAIVSSRGLLSL